MTDQTPQSTMMDATTTQAMLSALRSLLIAIGGVLTARGWISAEVVNQIVGAVLILIPAVWGIVQKVQANKQASAQAALALNVGAVIANMSVGKTPPIPAAQAPEVIKAFEPLVVMPKSLEAAPVVLTIPENVVATYSKEIKP